jgi:transcription antitermination factor NusG
MTTNWYALRSKARKEEVVWRQVRTQGYEVFYPRLKVQPVNPRARKMKPYFPGYMFVYVDIDQVGLSAFQWMPHAMGIVCFGDEPAIVPENLIYALQKRVDEISAAGGELFDGLHPGDKVFISEGPFAGYEAIFDARIAGSERVRVLLLLLNNQRQVPLEIQAGQIKRKKSPKAK